MLNRSIHGILFSEKVTEEIMPRLLELPKISGIDYFLEFISILQDLSNSRNQKLLSTTISCYFCVTTIVCCLAQLCSYLELSPYFLGSWHFDLLSIFAYCRRVVVSFFFVKMSLYFKYETKELLLSTSVKHLLFFIYVTKKLLYFDL